MIAAGSQRATGQRPRAGAAVPWGIYYIYRAIETRVANWESGIAHRPVEDLYMNLY